MFVALETLEGFLGGHVAPMSALTEEQRQNQYLAAVAQENVERPARGETALDPNAPENRERRNTAQVNNHGSLFAFSDNLTTLRETHQFPFSSGKDIPAYTFEAVRTVFVELLCTPKSSMKNPSLLDCVGDDFGHWTTDESDWRARVH